MNTIKNYYKINKTQIIFCLLSAIVFSLIAHAYGFLNNIFSHDSLNALYADPTENQWKIALGRFLVPFIRSVTRGSLAIPWLIGILATVYLFVASYLILRIFETKSKLFAIIVPAIMVTNVSVIASVATYIYEFDIDMLALLFSILSVYVWKSKNCIKNYLCSVLLIILSAGIYQSFICVAAVLMVFILILNLLEGKDFKNVFTKGVLGVSEIAIGSIIYYILQKLIIKLSHTDIALRTDALNLSKSFTENVTYLNGINATVFYEIQRIINPASILPSHFIGALNIILILSSLAITIFVIHKLGKKHIKEKLLALLLLAMIPVASGFIGIITKGEIHDLMVFAFWLVYIFILIVNIKYSKSFKEKYRRIIKIVSIVCISIIVWNNILVANTAYLKKDLEHDATLSVMTRVADDLNKREDYIPSETKVYFIGSDFLQGHSDEFNEVEKIVGLDYDTSIGMSGKEWYFCSYEKYFINYLGQPLIHADKSFITDEMHNSILEMPSFPHEGYMEKFGDVLVIRMN